MNCSNQAQAMDSKNNEYIRSTVTTRYTSVTTTQDTSEIILLDWDYPCRLLKI